MNSDILAVIGLLSIGYLLIFLEIFLPGGVLGVLGALSILYGCYLAFDLSAVWGMTSVVASVAVTLVSIRFFFKSRVADRLVLGKEASEGIQASKESLVDLVGQEGTTLSALRPAGVAEIGGGRIDVVADSEFLERGVRIRVVDVEGRRVVVEAAGGDAALDAGA